jgi:hypothetical protein
VKVVLSLVLVVLSALLLGAHFLRSGDYAGVAASLMVPALLFARSAWAVRVTQAGLLAAAGIWVATAVQTASLRLESGQPWARMAVILGAVAVVSVAGAVMLQVPSVRQRLVRAPGRSAGTSAPPSDGHPPESRLPR